jgi:hypothetical protein
MENSEERIAVVILFACRVVLVGCIHDPSGDGVRGELSQLYEN